MRSNQKTSGIAGYQTWRTGGYSLFRVEALCSSVFSIDAIYAKERPALGQLEINTANPIVLRFCGNYHQRSRKLTGSSRNNLLSIEVLHPLDTLSQKLLRIPLDVFKQKDMPDIEKILRQLKLGSK